MVLDGGRPDYLNIARLPHLDALMARGARFSNVVDGILEAETPAGHTTLSTGSPPSANGILGFNWANDNDRFTLFDAATVRSGAIERIMEAAHVPTIASLYKDRFPRARVVALSGHKYYAADPLGGPAADTILYYHGDDRGRYVPAYIPGHPPPPGLLTDRELISPTMHLPPGGEDTLVTKLALAAFARMHQRLTLINFPEFDWPLGHVFGGIANRARVIQRMRAFDRDLGMIERAYRKAGILKQTLFVVTADHGMLPIRRTISQQIVTSAVSLAGTTAPDIAFNTGAYVWLTDPTRSQLVARNILAAHDPGVQAVYYLSDSTGGPHYVRAGGSFADADSRKADAELVATLIDGREPAVVVLTREGQTFSSPSYGWKGDHGGASWQSQHIPLVIAGPGIRQGVVSHPARLEDVAPTVLAAMGVKPVGMDGTILTEALLNAPRREERARRRAIELTAPIVDGLKAQERRDLERGG
ncbi:MAG TPA: alkaline phosphatase family protein [Chloroflexota bacterium]|nr:alkaline phosphatase family protein [Chloroflexota bacterium]